MEGGFSGLTRTCLPSHHDDDDDADDGNKMYRPTPAKPCGFGEGAKRRIQLSRKLNTFRAVNGWRELDSEEYHSSVYVRIDAGEKEMGARLPQQQQPPPPHHEHHYHQRQHFVSHTRHNFWTIKVAII